MSNAQSPLDSFEKSHRTQPEQEKQKSTWVLFAMVLMLLSTGSMLFYQKIYDPNIFLKYPIFHLSYIIIGSAVPFLLSFLVKNKLLKYFLIGLACLRLTLGIFEFVSY